MFSNLRNKLSEHLQDDLKTARILFFGIFVAFLFFYKYGTNFPLLGSIPHPLLNLLDSIVAVLIFFAFYTKWGIKHKQFLIVFYLYQLNLINVYLLWGTRYMDMYAYQFIVTYVVAIWFFKTKKGLLHFIAIINVAIIISGLLSDHANSHSPTDFYMTYLVSQIVFIVLYRYRFAVEEKLIQSERKYRLLAEYSFDVICVHEANGAIEFVSPSVKRLLGYDTWELINVKPYDITHEEDKHIIKKLNLHNANHPSLKEPIQYRLRAKNGNYIWVETIFVAIEEHAESNGSVLSQTRDISKNKGIQLELEERTKELERSNADLETFAFVSSHDLQEPLRMITNYMQLLKKRYKNQLDSQAEEYIDFANRGASNLQQLIRDLLGYSRITRTELKKEYFSADDLLRQVLKNIEIELQEKKAKVEVAPLCDIPADRNLMQLVVQNLILNGIKYNHSATPTVTVNCTSGEKEIVFCIADNGMGISPAHQQRIFEPFHRLHTKSRNTRHRTWLIYLQKNN
jgi:PAS domain S-box-containing protein